MNIYQVLGPPEASYYQSSIEVMRGIIKIGYININTKISMLSSYLATPRQGHLEAVLCIMDYLKLKNNSQSTQPKTTLIGAVVRNMIGQNFTNNTPPRGTDVKL